ncbi:hypothetical protein M3Y97_00426800 [Aphelenchoides bicaudatus]|nr:hypothetical protein M3Y97_00426800 [Aphelenchoides bicaudatus]
MYCLQFLVPVLFIPKPLIHPTFLIDNAIFLWIYIIGFCIDKKPCHVCLVLFIIAAIALCYSDSENFPLWPSCEPSTDSLLCRRQISY